LATIEVLKIGLSIRKRRNMKVTDLKTMVVENEPLYSFGEDAPRYIGGKYLLFIELVTDEGITGLGERVTGGGIGQGNNFPTEDMQSQITLIHEIGRQYVIGEDPFNVEYI
jgi:L-alanine-DL-glutamate epimerase-like enolase superfamily enzyme